MVRTSVPRLPKTVSSASGGRCLTRASEAFGQPWSTRSQNHQLTLALKSKHLPEPFARGHIRKFGRSPDQGGASTPRQSCKEHVPLSTLKPEACVVTMVPAIIRNVLSYSQKRRSVMGFEVWEEETKQVIEGDVKANAIDDGGICSRKHGGEIDDFIALVTTESKPPRQMPKQWISKTQPGE